jgi:hypothetical protein
MTRSSKTLWFRCGVFTMLPYVFVRDGPGRAVRKTKLDRPLARRPDGIFVEQGEIGPELIEPRAFGFQGYVNFCRVASVFSLWSCELYLGQAGCMVGSFSDCERRFLHDHSTDECRNWDQSFRTQSRHQQTE